MFLCGSVSARDESGGRVFLGDNTGGEAVMLRPIRLQCGVQMDSLLYTYVVEHCVVSPDLRRTFRELNYCARQ